MREKRKRRKLGKNNAWQACYNFVYTYIVVVRGRSSANDRVRARTCSREEEEEEEEEKEEEEETAGRRQRGPQRVRVGSVWPIDSPRTIHGSADP